MKTWRRKAMARKAVAIKAKIAILQSVTTPEEDYRHGERHLRRHEYKRALAYFHRAAGQGVSKAWGKLAVMYHRGLGCSADYENARFAIKAARIAARLEEYETSCHV